MSLFRRSALLSLLLLPLSSACVFSIGGTRSVVGSGVALQETRALESFDSVELSVPADLFIRVGAAEPSFRIQGDDNIVPEVTTRVHRSELEIDLRGSYRTRKRLRIDIAMPSLAGVEIEGSGDVEIYDVDSPRLAVSIEGSGNVQARGRVDRLDASIEGSGDFDFEDLEAREADIEIEGSGSANLNARERLHYSIEGSGYVSYRGDPSISGGISGSGTIERR